MSATPAPNSEFPQRPILGRAIPLLAAVVVLSFVGFTAWFWQSDNEDLLDLTPLYLVALFFCVDMVFLRKRLRNKSREIT
jgi:hypothetical protein